MKLLILTIHLFLYASLSFGAENIIIYFGGGGEPKNKDTTIFDESIPMIASFAKSKGYKADYYFTDKHSTSVKIAESAIGAIPKTFTTKNWNTKIDQLRKDIDSGAIPKGTKIILTLDTHGDDKEGEFRMTTTDGIVAPEMELRSLIKNAEAKGVRFAIVATNCTSGNLLKLSSSNTCIITSSMPGQYGYSSEQGFFKNLNTSPNIEDVFLQTRKDNGFLGLPSQPAISSEAGLQTQEVLKILFPYLSEKEVDKPASSVICDYTSIKDINSLNDKIKPLLLPSYSLLLKNKDIQKLGDSVDKYNRSVQTYRKISARSSQNITRCFETPVPFIQLNGMGMFPPKLINMGMGGPKSKEEYEKLVNQKVPDLSCVGSQAQVKLQIQYHNEQLQNSIVSHDSVEFQSKIKNAITELNKLMNDPILSRAPKERAEDTAQMNSALETMINTRKEIAQLERKIYDQIYQNYSDKLKKRKNVCRDFTL